MSATLMHPRAADPEGERRHTILHLVDDDADVRAAVAVALQRLGCQLRLHGSAEEFLAEFRPFEPQALVLDLGLPGISGLELLETLMRRGELPPTLVLSAAADVRRVVQAMRHGAVDYVEKPPLPAPFVDAVQRLVDLAPAMAAERQVRQRLLRAYQRLTPREREVFRLLGQGMSTKRAAHELGISVRTAHIHRTNVMFKFGTESLIELARHATLLEEALRRQEPRA